MGWRRVGLVVLALSVASCGVSGGGSRAERKEPPSSTTSSVSRGSEENTGWLAADEQAAIFISYTDSDGFLSGSLQVSRLQLDRDRWTVTGNSQAFTGTVDGTKVSVTVGSAAPWFGTLEHEVLTLNIPQDDGSLGPVTLIPGSIASYNGAVGELRDTAASRNSDADAAETQAELEGKAAAALTAYNDSIEAVRSAGDDADAVDYTDDLDGYESNWQTMQDDVDEMKGSDCLDMSAMAGYVESDLGYLESDRGYVESTDAYADDAVTSVESAIGDATAALDLAQSTAEAAGTTGPDGGALDSAADAARTAVTSMKKRRTDAHARADEIDAAAASLNAQAQTFAEAHGC